MRLCLAQAFQAISGGSLKAIEPPPDTAERALANAPRIAGELVVTLDTVKNHVSHLLGKLGGANRTEAVTSASSA